MATLLQLKQRVRLRVSDLNEEQNVDGLLDDLINEGLRELVRKTLILEDSDSSLTYSSPGFTLPTDFIKVRDLIWVTSNNLYSPIKPASLAFIYKERNAYTNIDTTSADLLIPKHFAIDNGQIILDSTTQSSPTLYYYKYDTALSSDASSPTIKSEWQKYLIDYCVWQLKDNDTSRQKFELGVRRILGDKPTSRYKRIEHRKF